MSLLALEDLGVDVRPVSDWPHVGLSYGTKSRILPIGTRFSTTQKVVSRPLVDRKMAEIVDGNGSEVEVFRYKGQWWVVDGHHSLAAYILLTLPVAAAQHGPGEYFLDAPRYRRAS